MEDSNFGIQIISNYIDVRLFNIFISTSRGYKAKKANSSIETTEKKTSCSW